MQGNANKAPTAWQDQLKTTRYKLPEANNWGNGFNLNIKQQDWFR